jgi:WD40 repeat protein
MIKLHKYTFFSLLSLSFSSLSLHLSLSLSLSPLLLSLAPTHFHSHSQIWDTATRKVVAVIKGHRLGVQAVVTDGKYIYTGSDDCSIKVLFSFYSLFPSFLFPSLFSFAFLLSPFLFPLLSLPRFPFLAFLPLPSYPFYSSLLFLSLK